MDSTYDDRGCSPAASRASTVATATLFGTLLPDRLADPRSDVLSICDSGYSTDGTWRGSILRTGDPIWSSPAALIRTGCHLVNRARADLLIGHGIPALP